MKTLNLTDLEKSEIKYKKTLFPDKQQQLAILDEKLGGNFYNLRNVDGGKQSVQIKSRLNNFLDLELIICAVKSLKNLGVKEIQLYVPFFLGSRSDRKFEEGSNNYLKDVICPIVNGLGFESVTCIDPHSDVLEACLNNFKKEDNLDLVKFALHSIYNSNKGYSFEDLLKNKILISPDGGALKKIYKLAEQIGFKGDVITCSKSRDNEGKLTKTVVPLNINEVGKDIIIIDDICDGGRTFINIAKEIKEKRIYSSATISYGKIYLIVTHGIFSAGFKELFKHFDGIYCTNSYSIVSEFEWDGDKRDVKTIVKQLDVF